MAALQMINEMRPTARARHVEIQHFAIQEWRLRKDIIMEHVPGTMNCSDGMTKALGWVLHSRHARRAMGHFRLGSPKVALPSYSSPDARVGLRKAGEGVGDRIPNRESAVTKSISESRSGNANARSKRAHVRDVKRSPKKDRSLGSQL